MFKALATLIASGWLVAYLIGAAREARARRCDCGGTYVDWMPTIERLKDLAAIASHVVTGVVFGGSFGPEGGRLLWRCSRCEGVREPVAGVPAETWSALWFATLLCAVFWLGSSCGACPSRGRPSGSSAASATSEAGVEPINLDIKVRTACDVLDRPTTNSSVTAKIRIGASCHATGLVDGQWLRVKCGPRKGTSPCDVPAWM